MYEKMFDELRQHPFFKRLALTKTETDFNDKNWNQQIQNLWNKYLKDDKRSFVEYFKEEHNIEIDESISVSALEHLCKCLIGGKK